MLRRCIVAFTLVALACSSETSPGAAVGATGGGASSPDDDSDSGGATGGTTIGAGSGDAGTAGSSDAGGAPADLGTLIPSAPSDGCNDTGAFEPGTTASEIRVGSDTRTFRIHVPPGYDPTTPLPT